MNYRKKTNNKSAVLITGGSGLVGKQFTSLLLSNGYKVVHLSRSSGHNKEVPVFRWDPEKRVVDTDAFEDIDIIVHLAGANIGAKRWFRNRKAEIIRSRVDTTKFLFDTITERGIKLKAFISASAVGYYGAANTPEIFTEEDPPSEDFLGTTCRLWEEAAGRFRESGIRTVIIRTAFVLAKRGSGLSKLIKPAQYGFVIRLGDGNQYMPWIHISDLCKIYLKAIEDQQLTGPYNAVAPQHIDHKYFMKTIAEIMKRPLFLPPVPAFLIKAILGEMSDVILKGSRVSSEKITKAGFQFVFSF